MKNYHYEDGLQSKRLVTKFLEQDDWQIWSDFFSGNGDATFLPLFDETAPDAIAKKWINLQLKRYQDRTFGMQWMIEQKTGKHLGLCGLLYQNVNDTWEVEVGYSFFKSAWGQGFASEAAQMFRDYGFRTLDIDSIVSLIDPDNEPSQRVAQRNGMTKGPLTDWKGLKLNVWRISRADWLILQNASDKAK